MSLSLLVHLSLSLYKSVFFLCLFMNHSLMVSLSPSLFYFSFSLYVCQCIVLYSLSFSLSIVSLVPLYNSLSFYLSLNESISFIHFVSNSLFVYVSLSLLSFVLVHYYSVCLVIYLCRRNWLMEKYIFHPFSL